MALRPPINTTQELRAMANKRNETELLESETQKKRCGSITSQDLDAVSISKDASLEKSTLEESIRIIKESTEKLRQELNELREQRKKVDEVREGAKRNGVDFDSQNLSSYRQPEMDVLYKEERANFIRRTDYRIKELAERYDKRFAALSNPGTRFTDYEDTTNLLQLYLLLKRGVFTFRICDPFSLDVNPTRKLFCQFCGAGASSISYDTERKLVQIKRFLEASEHVCLTQNIRKHIIEKTEKQGEQPVKDDESNPTVKLLLLFERLCDLPANISLGKCTREERRCYNKNLSRYKLLLHTTGVTNHFSKSVLHTLMWAIASNYAYFSPPKSLSRANIDRPISENPAAKKEMIRVVTSCSSTFLHRLQGSIPEIEKIEDLGSIQVTKDDISVIRATEHLFKQLMLHMPYGKYDPLTPLSKIIPALDTKSELYNTSEDSWYGQFDR